MDSVARTTASEPTTGIGSGPRTTGGETSTVLVPLLSGTDTDHSLDLALAFAAGIDARVRILNPVVFPRRTPLFAADSGLEGYREAAHAAFHAVVESPYEVAVTNGIRVGHSVSRIISNVANEEGAEAVVLDRVRADGSNDAMRSIADRIARRTDCDVITGNGAPGFERFVSILVPVAGGPHSGLAVDVAAALARTHGAWVDLIYVADPAGDGGNDRARGETPISGRDGPRSGSFDGDEKHEQPYLRAALGRLDDTSRVTARVLEAENVETTITDQSRCYDCTVLGAPEKGWLRRFVAGSTTDGISEAVPTPVVTARRPRNGWYHRWVGR